MLLVWIDLLTSASYGDNYFDGRLVKKGQVIVGRKKLAEKLGLSEQCIRTCLDRLKKENQITIQTTNKYSIVTIVKWEDYQSKPEYINQPSNQDINQPVTNQQPASNQPVTTTKELKEVLEDKESFINSYTPGKNDPDWLKKEMEIQEKKEQEIKTIYGGNVFELFEQEFARPITQPELVRISEMVSVHGDLLVRYALREALLQRKRKVDYIDGILGNWKRNNLTVEDYEEGKR